MTTHIINELAERDGNPGLISKENALHAEHAIVDSMALFRVLQTLAVGTPEDIFLLRKSAMVEGSPLNRLVGANNIAAQRGTIGVDGMSVTESLARANVTESLARDNARLRQMLGEATCGASPYRDGGEFQCAAMFPAIDYMRDKVSIIRQSLARRKINSPKKPTAVTVDHAALTEVVAAFKDDDKLKLLFLWRGMGMGHCASAELAKALHTYNSALQKANDV